MIARRCFVAGRVQGVFYRASARTRAEALGVTGYARNLPDGRVEALAEGDLEAVERFGRQLARGPGGARVDRIDTVEEAPDGRVRRFEIRP